MTGDGCIDGDKAPSLTQPRGGERREAKRGAQLNFEELLVVQPPAAARSCSAVVGWAYAASSSCGCTGARFGKKEEDS